jgi:hypothetical protein
VHLDHIDVLVLGIGRRCWHNELLLVLHLMVVLHDVVIVMV